MASLFLSRILGILRDTVMTAKFGVGQDTDAYRLAFQIPDLLFFAVAGGALSSAFIPVFSEYFHTNRKSEAWKVFSVVTTVMSLLLLVLIAGAWIFALPLAKLIAPGKPDEVLPLIAQMSRILLPAQFAFFVGGLMFGTLYARKVFAIPGLGPNVYNLGIIAGAFFLSAFVTPGIVGMTWGALVGAIIGNLVIPLFALIKLGAEFKPSLDISHPGVKKVFKLMIPVVLGLSLPGVYGLIMQIFGSYYAAGINTALDLSNKVMQAPLGIFGQALALAVFPTLSQFFAENKMDAFRTQLEASLRTVLYLTVPVSAAMFVLAPEMVAVLFSWGKASTTDLSALVSSLQMFSIGVFAWCLHPTLMRAFFALQQTVTPVVLGTFTTAIFLGLVFGLKETSLSYLALPLASSISAICLSIMFSVAIKNKIGGLNLGELLTAFGKCALASALMGGLMFGISLGWKIPAGTAGNMMGIVKLAVLGCAGGWVYYAATRAMKMKETATIDRAMARITRRSASSKADGS